MTRLSRLRDRTHTRGAVFLDRDGVITELVRDPQTDERESPYRPQDVRLIAGAVDAIKMLRATGWLLVGVSNQPSAAKGYVSQDSLDAVHTRTVELLAAEGLELDAWRYCFHHPRGRVRELSVSCLCRKPAPGMLLEAALTLGLSLPDSWMVGDSSSDVQAGHAAGCRTVLLEHPGSHHRRRIPVEPDLRARDLQQATAGVSAEVR